MTVQGRNLNTGADIRVLFDRVPCHVEGSVVISHVLIAVTVAIIIITVTHMPQLVWVFVGFTYSL